MFESLQDYQERFDREIYLHYLEMNGFYSAEFKHVSREEYYNALYEKLDKRRTITSDQGNIYRISDEKEIWEARFGRVLGEVWKYRGMVSYWIKK